MLQMLEQENLSLRTDLKTALLENQLLKSELQQPSRDLASLSQKPYRPEIFDSDNDRLFLQNSDDEE